MRKCFSLSEEDWALLEQYKKENNIKNNSQAVSSLLHQNQDNREQLAIAIREELEKNYLPKERIRWATKTAEQNSIVILDAMNTLLHMLKADACIPVEMAAHPVVKQSQDRIKEKIAYFKQKSDERKSKENT